MVIERSRYNVAGRIVWESRWSGKMHALSRGDAVDSMGVDAEVSMGVRCR